ncbi:hypothetical protein JFL47_07375 [Haemophilus haemoglobinophilus]|nr:hypothetical protein [Canicola haemoglobinophilus]
MEWLDWLKIGGGVLILLAIVGYFMEKKEKAERKRQEEMAEEADFYDALYKNICPQCGSKGTLEKRKDEYKSTPYIFKGMTTEYDRRMESWERRIERALGCTKCDYHTVYEDTLKYDVKEIADDGYPCPKCNENDSVYLKDVKSLERISANKEVEETTARGTKTRYIKVMKQLEEETYACRNCDFTSVATVTRELG